MSLWSREGFVAVVAPSHVALRRQGATQMLGSVACGTPGAERDWSGAAEALAELVAAAGLRRGQLTVVLSSHLVRFRLLPWSDRVDTPDELEAYARIALEEVYGPPAAGWALRISPDGAGRARLAAAIEQALLDRLDGLARDAGLRLASVQPHFSAAFNRLQRHARGADFLFAVAEPGRLSTLIARAGNWAGVSSSAADDSDAMLAALLARECELNDLGGEGVAVYVHAPGRASTSCPAICGVEPQMLAMGPPSDAWAAMALVAS